LLTSLTEVLAHSDPCGDYFEQLSKRSGIELRIEDSSGHISNRVAKINDLKARLKAAVRVHSDKASALNIPEGARYDNLPDAYRAPSDFWIRLFTLGFVDPTKSRIKFDFEEARRSASELEEYGKLATKLLDMAQMMKRKSLSAHDLQVFDWLLGRFEFLAEEILGTSESSMFEANEQALRADLAKLRFYLTDARAKNPLILALNKSLKTKTDFENDATIDGLLGRDMDGFNSAMLWRLSKQYEIPIVDLVRRFQELDAMGYLLSGLGYGRTVDYVYDSYIIYLLYLGLDRGLSNLDLINRFRDIDDKGENLVEDWNLLDSAVVRLVKIQLDYGDSTEALVSESSEIYNKVLESSIELELRDGEIVHLMETRRMFGVSVDEAVARFIEIYRLGDESREDFYINKKASLALTRFSFERGVNTDSVQVEIDDFFSAYDALDELSEDRDVKDPNAVRFMALAHQYRMDFETLGEFVKLANKLTGGDIYSDREILARLNLAFAAKQSAGVSPVSLTQDELWEVLQIPLVTYESMEEWNDSARLRQRAADNNIMTPW